MSDVKGFKSSAHNVLGGRDTDGSSTTYIPSVSGRRSTEAHLSGCIAGLQLPTWWDPDLLDSQYSPA